MTEVLTYYTIFELRALTPEALQSLWELVPTDRQRAYKQSYEREVREVSASGSDALELQVTAELLRRYDDTALVPVGARWARTPGRVQDAARYNEVLEAPEKFVTKKGEKPTKQVLLGITGVAAVLLVFLATRLWFNRAQNAGATLEVQSHTATPLVTPTPTPLALEAQDEVIQSGDPSRALAYPVNLQVVLPDGSAPRVWVVQRRAIRASEWNFDPNPDTASFINGMAVRPVLGIPWSEENAAFFNMLGEGALFYLTMNTGAVLQYTYESKNDVRRSDTQIFRQVSPGLNLLLIGEMDTAGMPTATRTLITANYGPEQELARESDLLEGAADMQTGTFGSTLQLGETMITLTGIDVQQQSVSSDYQTLTLNLEISSGSTTVDTTLWYMELADDTGQRYLPLAQDIPPVDGTLPFELEPLSLIPVDLHYLVPITLQDVQWSVSDSAGNRVRFMFTITTPSLPVITGFDGVDVRLVSVTTLPGQITTQLRIYNGRFETLHFTQDSIWLALGYAPAPAGPRNPAEGLTPFDLLPEQAVDLTLVWYWANEPHALLGVGDYRFAIQITR